MTNVINLEDYKKKVEEQEEIILKHVSTINDLKDVIDRMNEDIQNLTAIIRKQNADPVDAMNFPYDNKD